MLEICFITDEKYVLPTLVAIKSLICNTKTPVNIYIVSSELSKETQKLFQDLETNDCKIYIKIAENPGVNIETEHLYVSKAAMLKFALPNIFDNLDKILYLDGDIIVNEDLSKLYVIALGDMCVAAAEDYCVYESRPKHCGNIGVEKYFNSGVMLLNLKKIREDNLIEMLIYNKINDKQKIFMDQDAFNLTFKDRVLWMSPEYNFLTIAYSEEYLRAYSKYSNDEIRNILKNIKIKHLAGTIKPWINVEAFEFDSWYYYCKMLKIGKLTKNIKKQLLDKKIERFNKTIILFLHKLFFINQEGEHLVLTLLGVKLSFKCNINKKLM